MATTPEAEARRRRVLEMLGEGMTHAAIAKVLGVTRRRVTAIVARIRPEALEAAQARAQGPGALPALRALGGAARGRNAASPASDDTLIGAAIGGRAHRARVT